jgi:L-aspartate oxidase
VRPATDLDLLVLGSGVAGLSAAVRAASAQPGLRVGVLTKAELRETATRWAQGGVAAVLGGDEDSTDLHLADTLRAGVGLCDVDAVRVLVDEGPARVQELIGLGAVFDTDAGGNLLLAREGGHSLPRVVHAGGAATGAEIERALVDAVHATAAFVLEHWFALDLVVSDGRCEGVTARGPDGQVETVRAAHTLLATGGAGQLFAVTTNPAQATGDGIAMAMRAGAAVADIEFMQFHPTALHHPAMPRPLLSEALRGHGALIRDTDGERFVEELEPRDVVARAITGRMLELGTDHCFLDATSLEHFDERFPTIAAALAAIGLDPARDWLPIAPAAHYLSGGVVTDLDGATALPGLWAAGEVACAGVHGANRLASNSLLDGMVFAARVVEALGRGKSSAEATGAMRAVLGCDADESCIAGRRLPLPAPAASPHGDDASDKVRARLQRAMTEGAGVLRNAESLARTRDALAELSLDDAENRNLATVAAGMLAAASAREESRGAHTRTDFHDTRDNLRVRLVIP